MLTLYNYYRSSAAYRVRIALALKKISYEYQAIHLLQNGGEQFLPEYRQLNPQCLVPTLQEGNTVLTQSLAIIEYLEEKYPTPALLPANLTDKAWVRSIAYAISCDIHPLNNLRVLKYLQNTLQISDEQKTDWMHHWINLGFAAIERMLSQGKTGKCCLGDTPTLADIVLVPQVYNAERFKCPLDDYPRIKAVSAYCRTLSAFINAQPENQPDFVC